MKTTPRHILVPVDGSDCSMHAVAVAGAMAQALGSKLTVMHVVSATSAEAMGMRSLSHDEVERHLDAAAEPIFGRVGDLLATVEGLTQHGELVRFGEPAEEVLTAVRRLHVDHVVMGSRGMSPMQELLLGSVSEKVVRRAPCPVTIVR